MQWGQPPTTGEAVSIGESPKPQPSDVHKWITTYKGVTGRLEHFEGDEEYSDIAYARYIAKPLLSMKTAGSVSVERVAKPLKDGVLTRNRNRLGNERRIVALRAGLNLNLKMRLRLQQSAIALEEELEETVADTGAL